MVLECVSYPELRLLIKKEVNVIYKTLKFALYALMLSRSSLSLANDDLPEIGTAGASALTIEQEKEYGWAFNLMANQSLPIIHDPVLNNYITQLGENIVSHADSVKLPFHFFLIEDQEINAAAFLGGYVKIHTGLFLYAKTESELASVLAHEVAHITQRHLARTLEKQSFSNPATLAATIGSVLLSFVNPAAGIAALSTTLAVSSQTSINYTRQNEYEADHIGIQILADAGYNPYGMANFFSKLAAKSQFSSTPSQMLLTHPLPTTRVTEARLRASQLAKGPVKPSLNYQLGKARITVRYNKQTASSLIKQYQADIKSGDYTIKQAAQYGLALAYFQNKAFEKAYQVNQTLLREDPDNLFYLDLAADIAIERDELPPLIATLSDYDKRFSNNEVVILNLVIALQKNKQADLAAKKITQFLRDNPAHILAHQIAIDVYQSTGDKGKEFAVRAEYLALQGRFREATQAMSNALVYTSSPLDQARYTAKIEQFKIADIRLKGLQQ